VSGAHPLDRPVWSALTTRQAGFAEGEGRALRFAPAYGPFAAAADTSPESLCALAALVRPEGQVALVETYEFPAPPGVRIVQRAICNQMTLERLMSAEPAFAFEDLTEADAAQMLALATLTKPGPFAARTHQLGKFVGVKQEGRLVAMAGERMKPAGFTEVSGVCTHPDWRGRGYAAGLMCIVAARIVARGETPFLHVYATNGGAIALYETLGFVFRRAMTMSMLART
jgi:predicted GNAT family acetyltransferase